MLLIVYHEKEKNSMPPENENLKENMTEKEILIEIWLDS